MRIYGRLEYKFSQHPNINIPSREGRDQVPATQNIFTFTSASRSRIKSNRIKENIKKLETEFKQNKNKNIKNIQDLQESHNSINHEIHHIKKDISEIKNLLTKIIKSPPNNSEQENIITQLTVQFNEIPKYDETNINTPYNIITNRFNKNCGNS